ncbi:serine/threonine-protein kinase [Streptomyces sp. A012304]|uniref:serine/threonine-protein kinase n=1 Tax=Streptomyces sp. A012304 TaxID=375446 RepID=UPI00222E834A|nr:serine/threonine-protein kinase [Streptomyces sp. A012304]
MDELRTGDPQTVGEYRLLGRLGSGGMGRVYLGRSAQGRTVAVKLVHGELAVDPEFRQRFRREVEAARRVVGEWTAAVVAADTEAPVPWVATAYVPALTLHEAVERHGFLPEESVWALAFGLTRALQTIHGCGLVHRDLKPSNVLLGLDGPRVIDFGIARAADGEGLTRTGMVVGTPGFLSPEQVNGVPVTGASDVFCLGAVLTFAATGRSPFAGAGQGAAAGMVAVLSEPPVLDGLTGPLRDLVESCLAKDPAPRPTPARIAEAAEAAGYDRSRPWLPPELLDHLGRHAARLLQLETPPPTTVDRAAAGQPEAYWATRTATPRPGHPVPGPPRPLPSPPAGTPQPHAFPAAGTPQPGPVHPAAGTPVAEMPIAGTPVAGTPHHPHPAPAWTNAVTTPGGPAGGQGGLGRQGGAGGAGKTVRNAVVLVAAVVLGGVLAAHLLNDKSSSSSGDKGSPTASAIADGSGSTTSSFRYEGTWRGTVTQGESNTYPVKAVYKGGKVGEAVATVDYPTLDCGGTWVLVSQTDERTEVEERITKGTLNCADEVAITLTPSTDGTLTYSFDSIERGEATLRRD